MEKSLNITADQELKEKSDVFVKNVSSDMYYRSELNNDSMSFEWLDQIEFACPYLDNIVRNPKVFLIRVNEVVKIEKAKKVSVESVKDLSKHTNYIEKIDPKTNEIQPNKLLITKREETFNIYENRFLYTLIFNLVKFINRKKDALEALKIRDSKVLEYAATTKSTSERINIELKIGSSGLLDDNSKYKKEMDAILERLKKISYYTSGWLKSEFYTSMEKARASFIIPPIRKTNTILKNPNFQIAMKLWLFLQGYEDSEDDKAKNILGTEGNEILKGILNDSFLMNYYVIDSISSSKKVEKEKLAKYAILMITNQIQRALSLLLKSGIKISEEEILKLIASEMENDKNKRLIDGSDVKKKFKSAMDEYLERTQEYL